MKDIIHDWDDEDAMKILSNCNKSMKSGDTIILLELTIKDVDYNWYRLYLDVLMMTTFGGKERSISQFRRLFNKTGFKMTKALQTRSFVSIIEAKKI
jgi:hypothetical protein